MRVSELAKKYAMEYIRFLSENDISISSRDAYCLFRYAVGRMYGERVEGVSPFIYEYFEDCKGVLEGVRKSCRVEDDECSEAVIEYSCVYALIAIQYCAGNARVGSRIS